MRTGDHHILTGVAAAIVIFLFSLPLSLSLHLSLSFISFHSYLLLPVRVKEESGFLSIQYLRGSIVLLLLSSIWQDLRLISSELSLLPTFVVVGSAPFSQNSCLSTVIQPCALKYRAFSPYHYYPSLRRKRVSPFPPPFWTFPYTSLVCGVAISSSASLLFCLLPSCYTSRSREQRVDVRP